MSASINDQPSRPPARPNPVRRLGSGSRATTASLIRRWTSALRACSRKRSVSRPNSSAGASAIALTRSLTAIKSAAGRRAMRYASDEVAVRRGGQRPIDPAILLGQPTRNDTADRARDHALLQWTSMRRLLRLRPRYPRDEAVEAKVLVLDRHQGIMDVRAWMPHPRSMKCR
jgi:hypothetical protein